MVLATNLTKNKASNIMSRLKSRPCLVLVFVLALLADDQVSGNNDFDNEKDQINVK